MNRYSFFRKATICLRTFRRIHCGNAIRLAMWLPICWLVCQTILISPPSHAQSIRFHQLSLEDGLSQTTIYSILQDQQGYMWFGTRDGLNRYDGTEFRIYRPRLVVPHSLSHPNIRAIVQDSDGILWLGTDGGGLNRFDLEDESFYVYRTTGSHPDTTSQPFFTGPAEDQILSLAIDPDGMIWVGTRREGLNRFDPDNDTFQYFRHDDTDATSLPDDAIWSLTVDASGRLWAGTENGLARYDGDGSFRTFTPGEMIWTTAAGPDGSILAGTANRGLLQINPETDTVTRLDSLYPELQSHISGSISAVLPGHDGDFWIASGGSGLFLWKPSDRRVTSFGPDKEPPFAVEDLSIRSLYKDWQGNIWIGTNASGIYSYSDYRYKFDHIPQTPQQREIFTNPVTLSFTEDLHGRIWVGTEQNGLHIFDPDSQTFETVPFDPDDPDLLNHHQIVTLLTDREGTIWAGTDGGGLERWSSDGVKLDHFRHHPDSLHSLSDNSVLTLHEDRSGRLWVGTYRGLNVTEPGSRRFRRLPWGEPGKTGRIDKVDGQDEPEKSGSANEADSYDEPEDHEIPGDSGDPKDRVGLGEKQMELSDDRILAVLEDREGLIWIGTHGGGLNRLDPATGTVSHYEPEPDAESSISSDRMNVIVEDSEGILWLGTYHGLNRFDPAAETFQHYTDQDGLGSNVIHGILRDDNHLWLSTNKGLSRFDITTGTFRNFGMKDGVQSNEFKGGAYFRSSSGKMYFGGINGFNVFHPEYIPSNPHPPPVVFTDFSVTGEPRKLESGQMRLSHYENFFSIRFAALDFVSPSDNRYRYRLEGLDPDWVDAGNVNSARYTKVPPGEYVFTVQAGNNDGVWNADGNSMIITITPPFWASRWFILSALLIFCVLIAIAYRIRVYVLRREERMRHGIARALHDDISGTLSSINMFSTAIKKKQQLGADSGKYLKMISESARDARDKMGDIIWYTDPGYDDWHSFADHLHYHASNLFDSATVKYHIRLTDLPDHAMNLETRQNLWLMVKEILVNIIRHSGAEKAVIIMKHENAKIRIEISDDGAGFNPSRDHDGNGIRNIYSRGEEIGASVNLRSKPGSGTRWLVEIHP